MNKHLNKKEEYLDYFLVVLIIIIIVYLGKESSLSLLFTFFFVDPKTWKRIDKLEDKEKELESRTSSISATTHHESNHFKSLMLNQNPVLNGLIKVVMILVLLYSLIYFDLLTVIKSVVELITSVITSLTGALFYPSELALYSLIVFGLIIFNVFTYTFASREKFENYFATQLKVLLISILVISVFFHIFKITYAQTFTYVYLSLLALNGVLLVAMGNENFLKILKVQFIGFVIFSLGFLFYANFIAVDSNEFLTQDGIQTLDTGTDEVTSFWDQIVCYARDFKECAQKETVTEEAEVVDEPDFNIRYEEFLTSGSIPIEQVYDSIPIQYQLTTDGEMTVVRLDCYFDKVTGNTPFYSLELNQKPRKGTNLIYDNEGNVLACKDVKANLKPTGKEQTVVIIPVLTMLVKSTYTQNVPVVSAPAIYKLYREGEFSTVVELEGKVALYPQEVKEWVTRAGGSYNDKGQLSNDLFSVSNENLKNQLPIILGDGTSRSIPFQIIMVPNKDLGKVTKGRIVEVVEPSSAPLDEESRANLQGDVSVDTGKNFVKYVTFKENEDETPTSILISDQSLKIVVESTLVRDKDRIKFIVTNPTFTQSTTQTPPNSTQSTS